MIEPATIEEIQRLLGQGDVSQREIARRIGVSRGTVAAVARGEYPRTRPKTQIEDDTPSGPPQRCPGCGGNVYMPCRLCRVRAALAKGSVPTSDNKAEQQEEPMRLELNEKLAKRFQRILARRQRRALNNTGVPTCQEKSCHES